MLYAQVPAQPLGTRQCKTMKVRLLGPSARDTQSSPTFYWRHHEDSHIQRPALSSYIGSLIQAHSYSHSICRPLPAIHQPRLPLALLPATGLSPGCLPILQFQIPDLLSAVSSQTIVSSMLLLLLIYTSLLSHFPFPFAVLEG